VDPALDHAKDQGVIADPLDRLRIHARIQPVAQRLRQRGQPSTGRNVERAHDAARFGLGEALPGPDVHLDGGLVPVGFLERQKPAPVVCQPVFSVYVQQLQEFRAR